MNTSHRFSITASMVALLSIGAVACSKAPPSSAAADTSLARDLQMAQTNTQQETTFKAEAPIPPSHAPTRRTVVVREHQSARSQQTNNQQTNSDATVSEPSPTRVPVDRGTHDVKQTKRDATIGAGAGAILGAITSRNKVKGSIIGGVVGGILGGVVGNNVDKKRIPNHPPDTLSH